MKRIAFALMFSLLVFSAPNAFALCEPDIDGPHEFGFQTWTFYNLPGPACWWDSGNASYLTNSCYGEAGFTYGYGVSTAYYEFVVPQDDIQAVWYADMRINFNDTNNSSFNQLEVTATVTHNSVPTNTTLFLYNGGMGDLNCYDADQLPFDAVAGDTVRITVEGRNWYSSGTTIQVTTPRLTNINF
jgi:hypothetical protein